MFRIIKEDNLSKARLGKISLGSLTVETPVFFPVATQGTVKGLDSFTLWDIGVRGILTNAYHLFIRPGHTLIKNLGGLHNFMSFRGIIITDSGGYQIFSLEKLREVSDEGVKFHSHVDGKKIFLTPQDIIKIQLDLGSDVILPLDECVKFPTNYDYALRSVERTISWAKASYEYFKRENNNDYPKFFVIIQGSTYPDLRKRCVEELSSLNVDGFAIGGLSVGEPENLRYNILSLLGDILDRNKMRYFMGYGKPQDILEAVGLGIDLFDCVVPTRMGRTGTALFDNGKLVIRNAQYSEDSRPIDENCTCYVCKNFSRAYLRHLINAQEMTGAMLITYHNIFWYTNFMNRIRESIRQGEFVKFKEEFLANFQHF